MIDYEDMRYRIKQIEISMMNDGQTKTIRLRKVNQEVDEQYDYDVSGSNFRSNRLFFDHKSGELQHTAG
jgi:hypothetical protein